jgi:hypothetical protein
MPNARALLGYHAGMADTGVDVLPGGTLFSWVREQRRTVPGGDRDRGGWPADPLPGAAGSGGTVGIRLLATTGRAPGALGLLVTRSLTAYAGYLATMRLGATVAPLNPAYPVGRNAYLCEASQVDLVLADDSGVGQLDELGARVGAPAVSLTTGGARRSARLGVIRDAES